MLSLGLVLATMTMCIYLLSCFLGLSSPLYTYYTFLMKMHQNDYESLNKQTLDEIPVYPGAELLHTKQTDPEMFVPIFFDEAFSPPQLQVFYGLKREVYLEEIKAYLRPKLESMGWHYVGDKGYATFNKDNRCISYISASFENRILGSESVNQELVQRSQEYETVYVIGIGANIDAVVDMPIVPDWYHPVCPYP
jgi:hypothetical protein